MNLLSKLFSITIISFVLSSCGDGDSTNSANNIAGNFNAATKDSVCTITDSTGQTRTVTTSVTGTGNIEGTIPTGLVMMSCTGGTYTDEATGTNTPAPDLRAGVNYPGGVLTIIASPISEVAFQLAMNAGGVTTRTITTQNAVTAKAFGLADDFISIIPDDLNTDPVSNNPEGKIAVVLAGISQLAVGSTSTAVITSLFNDIMGIGTGTDTAGVLDDINLPAAIVKLRDDGTSDAAMKLKDSSSTDAIAAITTDLAINTIEAYSDGNTATALTLADYMAAGINRVIATNLAAANAAILAASADRVDTTAKIQALIDNIPVMLTVVAGSNQVVVVNADINITFNNAGGAITNCAGNDLPDSLSVDSETCAISGTLSATQTATTYTVIATNSTGQESTATVNLRVREPAPKLADVVQAVVVNRLFTITFTNIGSAITDGGCDVEPNLPDILSVSVSLNNRTCEITGIPSGTQTAMTYTVTATDDAMQTDTATVKLTVNTPTPRLTNGANANQTVLINDTIADITFSNAGGTITSCAVLPRLPTNLMVNPTTCEIKGTPTSPQNTTTHTVTAKNDTGQTNTATVNLTVNAMTPIIDNGAMQIALIGTKITTITFTSTGGDIANCTIKPDLPRTKEGNPGGLSIDNTTCIISGTPIVSQTAMVYTVTAANVTGQEGTATVSLAINGLTPVFDIIDDQVFVIGSGIRAINPSFIGDIVGLDLSSCTAFPNLPGLSLGRSCSISGKPNATQTATTYTLTARNGTGQEGTISFSIRVDDIAPILENLTSLRTLVTGLAITPPITFNNTGGVISSCVITGTALPNILSISNTDCSISGTPTNTQEAITYTVTASNVTGQAGASVSINVIDPIPGPPDLAKGIDQIAVIGSVIQITFAGTDGGTINTCTVLPELPDGLGINGRTCAIRGTASGTQTAMVHTVMATSVSGDIATATVSITVNDMDPVLATTNATARTLVTELAITPEITFASSGSIASCDVTPELPKGLSVDGITCSISGTPSATQTATTHTVTAKNTTEQTDTATVRLTVNAPTPMLANSTEKIVFTGSPIIPITFANTGGAIISCGSSPDNSLPDGLGVAVDGKTCSISGTPTTTQDAITHTVIAKNSTGQIATASVSIKISEPDTTIGSARLGKLAGATVQIFRRESNADYTLLFTETTSGTLTSTVLSEIGNFLTHEEQLDRDAFYLYQVTGGVDFDVDNNGMIDDSTPTANAGIIRSFVSGSTAKTAGIRFIVSFVSEILYETLASQLAITATSTTQLNTLINRIAASIITDVDSDGSVNGLDVARFNPASTSNINNLISPYSNNRQAILDAIRNGGSALLNISPILATYKRLDRSGAAVDVALSADGDTAYLANFGVGFRTIDVRDPTDPTLLSGLVGSFTANKDKLFNFPRFPQSVVLSTDRLTAYVTYSINSTLRIIDVSISGSVALLGSIGFPGTTIGDVAVSGNTAYVTNGGSGLQVVDITRNGDDYIRPTLTNTINIGGLVGGTTTSAIAHNSTATATTTATITITSVALSANGNTAYVIGDAGLQILDVTDPTTPTLTGMLGTPTISAFAQSITLNGDHAYVTSDDAGLQIIDITTSPSTPTLAGSIDTTGSAQNVTLYGNTAYVADGEAGLQIINIADPTDPTLTSTIDTTGFARNVALSSDGNTAFVADDDAGLQIIDITNSESTANIIAHITATNLLGGIDTLGFVQGAAALSADGNTAYVGDSTGLKIIDVTDPANLRLLVSFKTDSTVTALAVYVSDNTTTAYVVDKVGGMQILDVTTDPSNVTSQGKIMLVGSEQRSAPSIALSTNGETAYVANLDAGLQIIDVRDPTDPMLLNALDTHGLALSVALSADGNIAYVADGALGLQIIDVSNPGNLSFLGRFKTSIRATDVILSLDTTTTAYVIGTEGAGLNSTGANLEIINVADSTNPTRRGRFATLATDVRLFDNNTVYVANGTAGLQIISVANPANPVSIGRIDTSGSAQGIMFSSDGSTAYVSNGDSGLQVINLDLFNAVTE